MLLGIKKKPTSPEKLTVRDFYNRRNKIVIIRDSRGIGDILNCRMLFSNFKKLLPDVDITFACARDYLDLLKNHPFLDRAIDCNTVDKNEYAASYDISSCCIKYESSIMGKNVKHRAEIWADHCGVPLVDHDMHLPIISKEEMAKGYLRVKQLRSSATTRENKNGPSVLFSPIAHEQQRSLTMEHIRGTIKLLRQKGLFVYAINHLKTNLYSELDVPLLIGNNYTDWMSCIHAADYVVTVDTSNFHYAGAIKKPMTGIFTHVDGKLRGKFYDFVLVQKHRDNGNWPCGPCYNYFYCTHEDCKDPTSQTDLRPCLTQLTLDEIDEGIEKMLKKWSI
jgi:ADP-heptose:LPS heptosyltransferase